MAQTTEIERSFYLALDGQCAGAFGDVVKRLAEDADRAAKLEAHLAKECEGCREREVNIARIRQQRYKAIKTRDAVLKKVRLILEGVESFGDGECDAETVAMDLRDVLDLARVDHSHSDPNDE
jgi:hypothetical protein